MPFFDPGGIDRASSPDVQVESFRDLEAWLLADDLRKAAIAFTAKPPAALDRDYCAEIRKTCSSVCRNLAEGFGRRRPSQFLPFVVIALGSLAEVQDQLVDATQRGYLTPAEFESLWALSNRARQTSEGLRQYLARCVRRSKHRRNVRQSLERQGSGS